MSTMARRATTIVAGLVLAGGVVAVTGSPAMAAWTAPSPCTTWFDNAGSGGAERWHVSCPGYWVTVSVTCSSGSPINGGRRWGYQKAECRNGAYTTSGRATASLT
ncbi:hypothetical protein GCM10022225_80070 [Plantactinospora mayteni]|uniref:Secreted protein n=1 Tax=Plantactinospora mayteni TaxID=566021 RepID=A0ABQ4F372_9ACTN|nr:hypothetical protein Pma05_79280 [Plantactinospora mayteni]